MRQYFVREILEVGQTITLDDDISHHIRDVLRMNSNDVIRIADDHSRVFLATIEIGKKVTATLNEELDIFKNERKVVYCAALIKKDKWDIVLQKAAELGATTIVPLMTQRSVVHFHDDEVSRKLQRWNKIVLEACQQCNRPDICVVEKPCRINDLKKYMQQVNLVAYENQQDNYAFDLLNDEDVCFVIGPEGGLTVNEVETLNEMGFKSCSLGKRILRAETAGLYMLTLIDARGNL